MVTLENINSIGVAEEVDQSDLGIPRIKLTQKMSEHFDQGLANIGEYYSVEANHNFKDAFKAIVFFYQKVFVIEEEKKKGEMFGKFVSATILSPGMAYPDVPTGMNGSLIYNFFLTPVDGEQVGKPFCLSLSATGTNTARKLLRAYASLKEKANKSSLQVVVEFSSVRESKEKEGVTTVFCVPIMTEDNGNVKLVEAKPEEVTVALHCYNFITPGLLAIKARKQAAIGNDVKVGEIV